MTNAAATSFAGYTGLEVALRTPKVKFTFPKAGSVSCAVIAGGSQIGSGSASKGSAGAKSFLINLTNNGRTYLYTNNGTAISLTVTCSFNPKKGKTKTSTSTVVLDT